MINWLTESSDRRLQLIDFNGSSNRIIVRINERLTDVVDEINGVRSNFMYDTAFMTIGEYLEYTKTVPSYSRYGENSNGSYTIRENGEIVMNMVSNGNTICVFPHQFNEILFINAVTETGSPVEFSINELGLYINSIDKVYVTVITK